MCKFLVQRSLCKSACKHFNIIRSTLDLRPLTDQVPFEIIEQIGQLDVYFWRLFVLIYEVITLINQIQYVPKYLAIGNYGQLVYQWFIWFILLFALFKKIAPDRESTFWIVWTQIIGARNLSVCFDPEIVQFQGKTLFGRIAFALGVF